MPLRGRETLAAATAAGTAVGAATAVAASSLDLASLAAWLPDPLDEAALPVARTLLASAAGMILLPCCPTQSPGGLSDAWWRPPPPLLLLLLLRPCTCFIDPAAADSAEGCLGLCRPPSVGVAARSLWTDSDVAPSPTRPCLDALTGLADFALAAAAANGGAALGSTAAALAAVFVPGSFCAGTLLAARPPNTPLEGLAPPEEAAQTGECWLPVGAAATMSPSLATLLLVLPAAAAAAASAAAVVEGGDCHRVLSTCTT
jgi:hypothetical protein